MRPNTIKSLLAAGKTPVGTFVFEFNTPGIARIIAEAGADFVVFDMEHTGWSVETIRTLLASVPRGPLAPRADSVSRSETTTDSVSRSETTTMVPLVRVPATEYDFIARVLDMGAMGIMVPMVESAEQARKLVASAKYPPVGRRGAAFGIAHDDYTGGDIVEKIASANREGLLLAQIETVAGLTNVEAIAATPGIDVLWIGQFDLSISMGIPGQFANPELIAAMDRVVAACKKHGKVAGIMAPDLASGRDLIKQGFRMISYSGDLWVLQAALRGALGELRQFAGKQ
ncbi:MAG: aldolase/citrate lyase family protein [Planctomycetaceae bacterium]|nr:aldolase/citrate lyase family protein [Planctomycetaceae bacterium]